MPKLAVLITCDTLPLSDLVPDYEIYTHRDLRTESGCTFRVLVRHPWRSTSRVCASGCIRVSYMHWYVPVGYSKRPLSPNALIIHYTSNNQIVRNGEMVLIDAGCEFKSVCISTQSSQIDTESIDISGYASDISKCSCCLSRRLHTDDLLHDSTHVPCKW